MSTGRLPLPRERWEPYLASYDEGLGLVYERLVLNDFLERLQVKFDIRSVLEAPLFGMAGVSGINSVVLARRGGAVTLVDDNADRLKGVERIWTELGLAARFYHLPEIGALPFADHSFDLAWNWAALWYLDNPAKLIRELARVSRHLVFIAMPNRVQVGYLLRKYVLERDFVRFVDEAWADIGRVRRALEAAGCVTIEEGVLDVPPWPDTVMPAAQVLARLGIRSKKVAARFEGDGWHWSTMDYYLGRRPELKAQMDRYAFLERAPLPWQVKSIWAHHRYIVARVPPPSA
jgi:SAM-dependent methyltransferase